MIAPDVPFYLRKRYYVMFMMFVGMVVINVAKINVSICLVDLTSPKVITAGNTTYIQEAEFNLSTIQKGIILSAHAWGFMMAPTGAIITNKFGGVTIFAASLFFTGCMSVLSPFVFQWSWHVFLLIRAIEGFLQGVLATALFNACAKWAIPSERSRMVNYSVLGITAGTAASHPVTGFITHILGWKYIFYITGAAAFISSLIIYYTIKNSLTEDQFITEAEKMYFEAVSKDVPRQKVIIPWKVIMTSTPVLAYLNDRMVESWSFSFLMFCLPLYIKDVYPSNIKDVGILSGIPHIIAISSIIISSWLLDYFRSQTRWSRTKVHKTFIMIGQVPGAFFLIAVGFWTEFHWALITFSLFKIFFSAAYASYYTLPLDMSLEHANVLEGLGISFNCVGAILNPIVMGYMVQNHLAQEWSRYFWFLSIFNLYGVIVFAIYGSGEVQPWAHSYKTTDEKNAVENR